MLVPFSQIWNHIYFTYLTKASGHLTDFGVLSEMVNVNVLHWILSDFVRNGQDKNNYDDKLLLMISIVVILSISNKV